MRRIKMKPGYKTSEFWIALSTQLIGISMITGIITPEQGQVFTEAVTQIVGGVMTAIAGGAYAYSRGLAKKV
jgi:hypothetical protein